MKTAWIIIKGIWTITCSTSALVYKLCLNILQVVFYVAVAAIMCSAGALAVWFAYTTICGTP